MKVLGRWLEVQLTGYYANWFWTPQRWHKIGFNVVSFRRLRVPAARAWRGWPVDQPAGLKNHEPGHYVHGLVNASKADSLLRATSELSTR